MPKTQSRSRRRPSTRARAPRRNETTQPTPPAAEPTGESSSGPIRGEPPTSGTNYADLSTEVLHLLLAQRNLALSGSRDVLLKRLADHDRIEIPSATTSVAVTPTPQYSADSLRALADNLAPLLRDVLARENQPPTAVSSSPPLPTCPTAPQFDLGNPSHVASLLSSPQASALSTASPLEVPCLPKKLEDQISKGEFVDFSSLLPGNSDRPSFAPIRLSLEGDQGFSIPLPNFSNFGKRPKIDSLDKWLTAFGIYASVVVAKFPHKASQLFAYQRIIREAAQKFKGLAWYAYDVEFRKLAAKNPALNWGERHLQLWLDKFTGLARSVCFVCGSADHLSDLCPLSSPRPDSKRTSFSSQRGLCRNFNGGIPCAAKPCPFEHRCNLADCGGRHGAYEHADNASQRTDDTPRRRKHK